MAHQSSQLLSCDVPCHNNKNLKPTKRYIIKSIKLFNNSSTILIFIILFNFCSFHLSMYTQILWTFFVCFAEHRVPSRRATFKSSEKKVEEQKWNLKNNNIKNKNTYLCLFSLFVDWWRDKYFFQLSCNIIYRPKNCSWI